MTDEEVLFVWSLFSKYYLNVVLNRTVDVESDWRFDNLCGSNLQSQNELYDVNWCYWKLAICNPSKIIFWGKPTFPGNRKISIAKNIDYYTFQKKNSRTLLLEFKPFFSLFRIGPFWLRKEKERALGDDGKAKEKSRSPVFVLPIVSRALTIFPMWTREHIVAKYWEFSDEVA